MIIVDSNEFVQNEIGEKLKNETKVVVRDLRETGGDFYIPSAFKDKPGILIERKTTSDLAHSVKTRRWNNQIEKMEATEEVNDIKYYFLLEGRIDDIYKYTNFHPNSIAGVIVSILFDRDRNIIPSPDKYFTRKLLVLLMNRVQMDKEPKPKKLRKGSPPKKDLDHWARFIVEGYPRIGGSYSGKLLEEYGSVYNVIKGAINTELTKIDGIGDKTQRKIKNISTHIHSLHEFERSED